MCNVVAVNRIGSDANGMPYVGHSQVIDELGNELVAPFEEDAIKVITLDKKKILESRNKFHFLNDQDIFEIQQ